MPPRPAGHTRGRSAVLSSLTATVLLATGHPATAAPAGTSMNAALTRAAEAYGVPRDLLVAVGYGETHLDGHAGRPSQDNGYGVMHLVSNPVSHSLEKAAALTGESTADLRGDTRTNILGGAAVLRDHADTLGLDKAERADINAWYPAVARYSGAEGSIAALYADTVYTFLAQGLRATVTGGERVSVTSRPVAPEKGPLAKADVTTQSPDYPPALWVAANSANYATGRTATVDKVVIHVAQGSYAGTISWFQNATSKVSSHYVVRSSDGQITQMVRDKDTAYHAKTANPSALGIEHEGFIDNASWFTDTMYRSSAALTAYLCDRYDIPKNRSHVIGHSEAPGNDHTDPGANWNWTYYMQLVGGSGTSSGSDGLTFGSYTTQSAGSTGAQVKAVQTLLNQQGYEAGSVDGAFGAATTSAVQAFQTARGLLADGVVGAKTWTALLSAGTTETLVKGSSGDTVKRVQRALTAALGRTVTADGTFDAATDTAVRAYQNAQGLTADGSVGPDTWAALQSGR
ncbi:peptidoglycan-binding protein [Streptomyces sp. NPDC057428]|uniref:peptidoglycan-binding protein n=1 Tax=Streptomyces sp. NPDC057428 TaxID=3346129 RepID=UPI0036B6A21F